MPLFEWKKTQITAAMRKRLLNVWGDALSAQYFGTLCTGDTLQFYISLSQCRIQQCYASISPSFEDYPALFSACFVCFLVVFCPSKMSDRYTYQFLIYHRPCHKRKCTLTFSLIRIRHRILKCYSSEKQHNRDMLQYVTLTLILKRKNEKNVKK